MGMCRYYRGLIVEKLFGKLSSEDDARLNRHLHRCRRCSRRLSAMQRTLGIMKQREIPQPAPEFWENYWVRLQARMAREEERSRVAPFRASERGWVRIFSHPEARIAGMALVLIFGIVLGRYVLISPRPERSTERVSMAGGRSAGEIRNIEYRTDRYFERSKILLLALVNADPVEEDRQTLNFPVQRRVSQDLVREAAYLKDNLVTNRQRRLATLIEELQIILLEIANMEEQEDIAGIEMLKSSIERKGVLMKINIEEMNASKNTFTEKNPADTEKSDLDSIL